MEEGKTEIMKEVKIRKVKIKKLESDKSILQKQTEELRKLSTKNQHENEELEQFGRRLCLRIDGVLVEKGEASEGVLEKVTSMYEEADLDIPDVVIDRAYRIGNKYGDNSKNFKCQSIILRFTTFRHRTRFYRVKQKLIKVSRLNLT